MSTNLLYLISFLTGTIASFFAAAFVIEICISLFSVKSYRLKSLIRLLPFCSLFIDLLFNQFSLGSFFNPLSCQSCLQNFVLYVFFPELKTHLDTNQLSLIDHLAITAPFAPVIFVSFASITVTAVLYQLYRLIFFKRWLQMLVSKSAPFTPLISNVRLAAYLKQKNISLYQSDQIQIPMAAHGNKIFIPTTTIQHLDQNELEAVIAHELDHLCWKDSFTRLFHCITSSFFWWIPTSSWVKKLEHDQEVACDSSIFKYEIDGSLLASALIKVTKLAKARPTDSFCYLTTHSNRTLSRLHLMLGYPATMQKALLAKSLTGLVCVLLIVCMMSH